MDKKLTLANSNYLLKIQIKFELNYFFLINK
jgi:hypothetical protein